jgi:uncharacterized tellurite resistance protein B-like protein
MEQNEFQKLLLKTAVCSIACDGDIDEREIAELRKMVDRTQYFNEIKVGNLLDEMILDIKADGRLFFEDFTKTIEKADLSLMQELLVIEVILRIFYADERIDDNEITLFKVVRSKFKIHNEIIHQRFGDISFFPMNKSEHHFEENNPERIEFIANKLEIIADAHNLFEDFFVDIPEVSLNMKMKE